MKESGTRRVRFGRSEGSAERHAKFNQPIALRARLAACATSPLLREPSDGCGSLSRLFLGASAGSNSVAPLTVRDRNHIAYNRLVGRRPAR